VGLIRGTGPTIRSLYESGSAIERMTARILLQLALFPDEFTQHLNL